MIQRLPRTGRSPRWLLALGSLVLISVLIAWRASQPEFAFLAGRAPLHPTHEVMNVFAFTTGDPKSSFHTEYGFKADFKEVVRQAERQLLRQGYTESFGADIGGSFYANFVSPTKNGPFVHIDKDCREPSYFAASDLPGPPIPEPGWVAVLVIRSQPRPSSLCDRVQAWFQKLR